MQKFGALHKNCICVSPSELCLKD